MPQNASGTQNSASFTKTTKKKVGQVQGKTGKPNQTVGKIREQYAKVQQENFDKAMEALKKFKDPNQNTSLTGVNMYTREQLRQYLQRPESNGLNLLRASRYLYYRSQIYFRLVNWYAGMWDLRCRKVIPSYDLTKDPDPKKMLKSYNETLDWLDRYRMHVNFFEVLIHCYVEDVCYAVSYRTEEGSFFYILDPEECTIVGRYMTGDLAYAMNMSKWNNKQRRELAEWLGSPFTDMLKEFDRTKENWIQMPDEYAACFKFRIEDLNHIIVPFASLLQQLAGLSDTEDLQGILDDQAVFRLIAVPMPLLSNAKTSDEFAVSPDLLIEYFNVLKKALPDYVSAAPIPGEITNDNVIDFSETAADKDINRLQNAQTNVLNTAGGGAVIAANNINSTAAFNAWLKSETEFAISSLIGQVEGFTNRVLAIDASNPCRVEYFEVSVYTKQELAENLLTACQHSFSDRLALQTLYGISEKTTLAMEYFETEVLKLPERMNHPLNSSYTQSGNLEDVGRPEKDPEDLSPSGERSRNA